MSWISDKFNFRKGQSLAAFKAPPNSDCSSNENHPADPLDETEASVKSQATMCKKLIMELWLAECEESLNEQNPTYCTAKQQSDKLLAVTKAKALRRGWQKHVA
jgi:hypothetical protein